MARDPIAVALEIAGVFETLGIPYYLVGSLASSFHGEPRSTRDVDFVASITTQDASKLGSALVSHYYIDPAMIVEAIRRQSSFNLLELESLTKVDVFAVTIPASTDSEFTRAQRVAPSGSDNATLLVASPEDTVIAKLVWYRKGGETSDRQWSDVIAILRIQGARLDRVLLAARATQCGVEDLLERARSQA